MEPHEQATSGLPGPMISLHHGHDLAGGVAGEVDAVLEAVLEGLGGESVAATG